MVEELGAPISPLIINAGENHFQQNLSLDKLFTAICQKVQFPV